MDKRNRYRSPGLPASPTLEQYAREMLAERPMFFSERDQTDLLSAFLAACDEFGYCPIELAIESWQDLDAGYWRRALTTDHELLTARNYIRRHAGWRFLDGRPH